MHCRTQQQAVNKHTLGHLVCISGDRKGPGGRWGQQRRAPLREALPGGLESSEAEAGWQRLWEVNTHGVRTEAWYEPNSHLVCNLYFMRKLRANEVKWLLKSQKKITSEACRESGFLSPHWVLSTAWCWHSRFLFKPSSFHTMLLYT